MDAGAQRVCFPCVSARECAIEPAQWTEYGAGLAQASAYSLRRSVTLSHCPPVTSRDYYALRTISPTPAPNASSR